jgi:hypothetical protein
MHAKGRRRKNGPRPSLRLDKRIAFNSVVRIAGLALIIAEGQRNGVERPTLILAYLAMMGLPNFWHSTGDKSDKSTKP